MTYNDAYTQGFLQGIARLEKSAKSYARMTPEEQAKANQADKKYEVTDENNDFGTRNPKDPYPTTFKDTLIDFGRRSKRKAVSLGRGLLSAGGVAGVRALEGAAEFAVGIPAIADSLLMGRLAGVDGGRGFLGRLIGKGHRYADSKVHALRQWSEDYDYKNRINSPFNRFVQGVGADAVGTFVGWGGVGGVVGGAGRSLMSRVAQRALPLGFGTMGAYSTLGTDGQAGQLRAREQWIRSMRGTDPRADARYRNLSRYAKYIDPTATPTNIENAPTDEEYQRYYMPSSEGASSYSGKIRLPYNWTHDARGSEIPFRDFSD